jgi:peroxiredoxin
MQAYRDQYAKLFNNGNKVTVVAISSDDPSTLVDWAREKNFPVTFASDPNGDVLRLYDSKIPLLNYAKRNVFVVGPDGRIAHVMAPFKEMAQPSYDELGAAVAKALGNTP